MDISARQLIGKLIQQIEELTERVRKLEREVIDKKMEPHVKSDKEWPLPLERKYWSEL